MGKEEEIVKKDHTRTPGNCEVYRTRKEGKVIEIGFCSGQESIGYKLLADGMIKLTEYVGASVPKGIVQLKETDTDIQRLFKQEDDYTWCDCGKYMGDECIFRLKS